MTVLLPQPKPTRDGSHRPLPRRDPITRLPVLVLYPHSKCNCRCLMCDIWRAKDKQELQPEEIARWLGEWRELGIRRVVLSGGEPLMHSRMWEMCEHLRQADIGITVLSTGLLLRRHAPELVRYCDDVIVSLDGPPEIHDRIRNVPRAFEKLADGVSAVREAGTNICISARCTVQRENFRYLRATVEAAMNVGFERISFLAADVKSEAFNRPGGWPSGRVTNVALNHNDLPELKCEIDALEWEFAGEFQRGFISESPAKLRRRLLQYFSALLGSAEFHPNECNAPWVSSVIEADGTVRPCFFHAPIGNIRESGSLEAVLNSPKALAFRGNLDVKTNPMCRQCVCTLALQE